MLCSITVGFEGLLRRYSKKESIEGNEFCHFSIQIDLASKLIAAAL